MGRMAGSCGTEESWWDGFWVHHRPLLALSCSLSLCPRIACMTNCISPAFFLGLIPVQSRFPSIIAAILRLRRLFQPLCRVKFFWLFG